MNELSPLQLLIVALQRKTLGLIRPQLRAVKAGVAIAEGKMHAFVWVYYDGEISPSEEAIIKRFKSFTLDGLSYLPLVKHLSILRCDYSYEIPEQGYFVYLRDESKDKIQKQGFTVQLSELYFTDLCSQPIYNVHLVAAYALLGTIRPNLRAVKGDINETDKTLYLWLYFDGEISSEDKKIAAKIGAAMSAGFNTLFSLQIHTNRLDYPREIPSVSGYLYKRDESALGEEYLPVSETLLDVRSFQNAFPDNSLICVFFTRVACRDIPHSSLRLSFMWNALQGEIKPNLRAIKVEIDEVRKKIDYWLYFEGEIEREEKRSIFDKLFKSASFGAFKRYAHIERLDFPEKIPSIGQYLYLRDESLLYSSEETRSELRDALMLGKECVFFQTLRYRHFHHMPLLKRHQRHLGIMRSAHKTKLSNSTCLN